MRRSMMVIGSILEDGVHRTVTPCLCHGGPSERYSLQRSASAQPQGVPRDQDHRGEAVLGEVEERTCLITSSGNSARLGLIISSPVLITPSGPKETTITSYA